MSDDDFVPMDKSSDADAAGDLSSKPDADSTSEPSADSSSEYPTAPPPASFEVMVSMMFTQAMAALGQMPNPATGKAEVNKPFAKHFIDTLDMLGEKTKGNLTDDESKMLSEALHVLRMSYVGAKAE